jgi:DNA-binding MarR family transcriptional regulator
MEIGKLIKQDKFKDEYHKVLINIIYTANDLNLKSTVNLKPFGISPEQFNVLRILRGQHPKPVTVNLIIERMLNKNSNASRLVEKLRLKKLVERTTCNDDRRSVNILITKTGLELLKQLDKMEEDWINDLKKHLTESEASQLSYLLDKMRG